MNTFDWVKINTSFQLYSKETLKGMARFQHYKVVHLEKRFFFLSFPLSTRVCVSILPKNIYIYNRVKIRHGEEGGGESGEDEGEVGRLVLEGNQCRFPSRIYIYIIDQKYDTPCLGCH